MWRKVKQNTTAMFEKIKSRNTEESAELIEANEHFNDLKLKTKELLDNATAFADSLKKLGPITIEATRKLRGATETIINHDVGEFFNIYVKVIETYSTGGEELYVKLDEKVLNPVKSFQAQLVEYEKIKAEHDKTALLLESNKDKLQKLQQKNKQPAEIQRYQEKVSTKTTQIAELEKQFCDLVGKAWESRSVILQKPVADLNQLMYDYCQAIRQSALTLQSMVGQELMERQYPAAEVPTGKK